MTTGTRPVERPDDVTRGGRRRALPARGAPGEPRNVGYLYVAPAFLVFTLFVLVPFARTVNLSLFEWDGVGPARFVGFANYGEVVRSAVFRDAFVHALVLIVFYAVLPLVLGLLLASVMHRGRIRGLPVYRALLFLPYVVAPTAVAVIWRWLLAPDGPVNSTLEAVGLGGVVRPWLGDFTFALPTVGLIGTWVLYGLVLVLLLAGIQKIPTELYEAARIDGAGGFWEFRAVTLPGLRYEIAVALVLTVTAALRSFDVVYVLTQGGPGTTTVVPSYLVYQQAFIAGRLGAAAAVGVVLVVLIAAVNLLISRLGAGSS